ncbi:endopeptidase La [bacterium]|nr:endopeptidase La [bacterium]
MIEKKEETTPLPSELPLVPLRRGTVIFPNILAPLEIGRPRSYKAIEEAMNRDKLVVLVAQKDPDQDEPGPEDLYKVGVVGEIVRMLPLPNNVIRVLIGGVKRVRIEEFLQTDPYFLVRIQELQEIVENTPEVEANKRLVVALFEQLWRASRAISPVADNIPPELVGEIKTITDPGRVADIIAYYLGPPYSVSLEEKQGLLSTLSVKERLEKLTTILRRELEVIEIEGRIKSKVEKEIGESQREFILRERLKALQEELGMKEEGVSEWEEYRKKIEAAGMPEEVKEKALKELERLTKMPSIAPEAAVIRTWLDWLVELPWNKRTEDNLDIEYARKVLDEDHYGLNKVKERVLEFLAVRKLKDKTRGPILAFIGPPGVGKTSIGRSIARAMGRKFIRISLGGVRDEAEIRGHRRTYVGALPGRIIQGMRTVGTKNPVFMLDEIDKLGIDFRGDPSSALLEALDPEQNYAFSDHYLEVPFDLSEVMFICTGNVLDTIPPALRDRMEVIEFPGYTEEEKLNIAKYFLVPKQMEEHGLRGELLEITDDALMRIIREYTREAGVRNLEREIANICRKVAVKVASGNTEKTVVDGEAIPNYLGAPRFRYGVAEKEDEIGVATALVWTPVGGDTTSVEVAVLKGKGQLILTGRLGEVMRESAQAALTYVRSRAKQLGIDERFQEKVDIHIHVPEGSIPKDGPSAGITMACALASALSGIPVRKDVAMTGEITLRGKVLPVGGVKEKVLAAHRAGIKTVILPLENKKDLSEVSPKVLEELDFKFVEHMDEVLEIALAKDKALAKTPSVASEGDENEHSSSV